jgi:oxygen-dependent protoporphyrinogen oxidase
MANRYLVHNKQLLSLPIKLGAMIMSPLWSFHGKLRMLTEPFIPKGGNAQETVSEFITRRLGHEVLEKAMGSFVSGTLASDPDLANAYAVLPRLTALEQHYGSFALGILINKLLQRKTATITEAFSFQGGMSTLVNYLAKTPGVQFRSGYKVTEIERYKNAWNVNRSNATIRAQQIVLSTPPNITAALVNSLDSKLANYLSGIKMAPLLVVHLGFSRNAIPHSLDGTGFLVPLSEGFPVTGCLWMSSLFQNRTPNGKVLFSSYLGGATQPAAVDWDEERCIAAVMTVLKRLLRVKSEPETVRIDRHYQGLPLYYGNYTGRIAAIATQLEQLPGLHLEANYRGGVSIRDRIARAATVAECIIKNLN